MPPADPLMARHVDPGSIPVGIGTTSGFTESLESLTWFDRQTHKTHTHATEEGPAGNSFIKRGVDCAD